MHDGQDPGERSDPAHRLRVIQQFSRFDHEVDLGENDDVGLDARGQLF
jgi:hypothetical protein